MIELIEATIEEQEKITEIMTASFNYDTAFYFGKDATDGPEGYSDGSLATKILTDSTSQTWLISYQGEIAGFLTIDSQKWEVQYFCLFPLFINQGMGTKTWEKIEEYFGHRPWFLETPAYSTRNHAFYEKLDFAKVGEKEYPNGSKSFLYEKIRR